MNKNESRECAHEGQLINQCANCIRSSFIANMIDNAMIELTDHDCMIIANAINDFCARIDAQGWEGIDSIASFDDLHSRIDLHFEIIAPIIIEFCDILIMG